MEIRAALNVSQLGDVPVEEIVDVGLEESLSTAALPTDGFGKASPDGPLQVVGALQHFRAPPVRRNVKDAVYPFVGRSIQLALREWPQLHGFGASDQSVGNVAQPEQPRRARQDVLARALINIDPSLDGKQQLRSSLDLVHHQQAVMLNEGDRVCGRRLEFVGGGPGRRSRTLEMSRDTSWTNVLLPAWRAPITTTTRVSPSASVTKGAARRSR
jgi:hypothetical protein